MVLDQISTLLYYSLINKIVGYFPCFLMIILKLFNIKYYRISSISSEIETINAMAYIKKMDIIMEI